ncbi:unnamed protein product, partial [Iphiclides podalirius]
MHRGSSARVSGLMLAGGTSGVGWRGAAVGAAGGRQQPPREPRQPCAAPTAAVLPRCPNTRSYPHRGPRQSTTYPPEATRDELEPLDNRVRRASKRIGRRSNRFDGDLIFLLALADVQS